MTIDEHTDIKYTLNKKLQIEHDSESEYEPIWMIQYG